MKAPPLVKQIYLLMNAMRGSSMQNNLVFARQNNLSMTQMGTLFRLRDKGTCGVSHISEELGVSSAAVSQMLERLVQQGLILRSEAQFDRRAKVIELTEKGCRLVDDVRDSGQQWMHAVVEMLTEEEQRKIAEAIGMLLEKIQQMGENKEESR